MNAQRSSEVVVSLDPATAFDVFTQEIDYWWLRGPINNWDSARVTEVRCEPGIGGRLLEIYDEDAGDMLELARITTWDPGRRLAWDSSVDDVHVEVGFEPTARGTRVRLEATLAAGGKEAGGLSFIGVTPSWYGSWCAERDAAPRRPRETGRLGLALDYADPAAAARWLRDVFGLRPSLETNGEIGGAGWIEFRVGDAPLMVFGADAQSPASPRRHAVWVFVDDLDAHYERAREGGATIVEDIHQHGYRAYVAEDTERHRWVFAQARPTMERPADPV